MQNYKNMCRYLKNFIILPQNIYRTPKFHKQTELQKNTRNQKIIDRSPTRLLQTYTFYILGFHYLSLAKENYTIIIV